MVYNLIVIKTWPDDTPRDDNPPIDLVLNNPVNQTDFSIFSIHLSEGYISV